ncbi:hypothetical protein EUGRSUZ_J02156 [Eucalyptus grandis]|uniref:Uncharacterized protein n=2 Tax=Eucalyptus grandis TaxID=71139 RepID=A0ACC3J8E0_EUCGR|nr:hypothetical protein EUGRSUZ_J02156 [Eucalyptus grandis]
MQSLRTSLYRTKRTLPERQSEWRSWVTVGFMGVISTRENGNFGNERDLEKRRRPQTCRGMEQRPLFSSRVGAFHVRLDRNSTASEVLGD